MFKKNVSYNRLTQLNETDIPTIIVIIMDNSHDPKKDDGQASAVHPDVDSPVHV